MTKDNTLIVKINGQVILDMKEDIAKIKEILEKGNGKISNNKEGVGLNRKLIYGAYTFTLTAVSFIIGYLLKVKP